MLNPKISIIIPIFNCEKYINDSFGSLFSQTYSNFEIIAIDDASTDNSFKILNSFTDPRLKVFQNPTQLGVGKTLNKCVNFSRGEFIARMDGDDICLPERLEKELKFLEQNVQIGVVFNRVGYIDDSGNKINFSWRNEEIMLLPSQIYWTLPRVNCVTHVTAMFRRSILIENQYDENIFAEDYELWMRLSSKRIKFFKINEILMLVRKHSTSITNKYVKKRNGWIEQMLEAKKCYILKSLKNKEINFFLILTFVFLIKDIILWWLRPIIRVVIPNFDR